jgi:serine/threonine protein kinase
LPALTTILACPQVISLPNHEQRIALESKNGTGDTVYYGPPVDIWAVGVLAYELLVGRPPFEVEEERDTVMRIMYHTDIEFPCYVSKSAQAFILEVSRPVSQYPTGQSATTSTVLLS